MTIDTMPPPPPSSYPRRIVTLAAVCTAMLLGALAGLRAQVPATTPPAAQGQAPTPAGARGGGRGAQAEPQAIRLWDGAAPGALGEDEADAPTMTLYPAGGRGARTAVVIAPGGAYAALSMNNEGRQWAYWFNAQGVTAFVLRYRLGPKYHHPVQIGDAQRAIRLARSRAASLGYETDRIGMMGFSAGGHLTATTGTRFDSGSPTAPDPIDRVSSRPDFLVLAYPVISFQPDIAGATPLAAYANSGRNLLGADAAPSLMKELSAELNVTANTPPTFLFHTSADTLVPVENSVAFYAALRMAKVPAEMHVFERGGHGAGMGLTDPALSAWPTLLMNWLRARGLLTAPTAGR